MKNKLLIVCILLALVLGACAYEMISIDNISAKSCEIIDSMQAPDSWDNKKELKQLSNELYELWSNKIPTLSIFVQHEMIDEIEQSIAIIKNSIEQDDEETFQVESTRAVIQVRNLRDTEFPYIENIL